MQVTRYMIEQLKPAARNKLQTVVDSLKLHDNVASMGLELEEVWVILKILADEARGDVSIHLSQIDKQIIAEVRPYFEIKEKTLLEALWYLTVNLLEKLTNKQFNYSGNDFG